jgi:putative endonuclease
VSTRESGRAGEELAARHLVDLGYRIIERNFSNRTGEVDIVAVEGGTIAFCEVKSWERMPISGLEHVLDRRKQGRIIRTALWFLAEHPEFADYQPRFDLLFVSGGTVTHLPSAFEERGVM